MCVRPSGWLGRLRRTLLCAAVLAQLLAPLAAAAQTAAGLFTADSVRAVRAHGGMVVSESALASEVGRDVLEVGGNAVDAAIATTTVDGSRRSRRALPKAYQDSTLMAITTM